MKQIYWNRKFCLLGTECGDDMRISFGCVGTSACCYYLIVESSRVESASQPAGNIAALPIRRSAHAHNSLYTHTHTHAQRKWNKCFNFRIFLFFFCVKKVAIIAITRRQSFGGLKMKRKIVATRIAQDINWISAVIRGEANKRNDFLTHPFLECNRPIVSLWQFREYGRSVGKGPCSAVTRYIPFIQSICSHLHHAHMYVRLDARTINVQIQYECVCVCVSVECWHSSFCKRIHFARQ